MKSPITAECLLFDASPDQVIHTLEALGATRRTTQGIGWTWHYPSVAQGRLVFRLSVASWADAERLALGSTITHEMIADMMMEEINSWFQAVATAVRITVDEAKVLITEKCNVIVRCSARDDEMVAVLRKTVLALLTDASGVAWSGGDSWTSASVRENPASLRFVAP